MRVESSRSVLWNQIVVFISFCCSPDDNDDVSNLIVYIFFLYAAVFFISSLSNVPKQSFILYMKDWLTAEYV